MHFYEDFYELTTKEYGNLSDQALSASDLLAGALFDSQQFIAYERQCVISYQMSRQLHGALHPKTIAFKNNLDYIEQRTAMVKSDNDRSVNVMGYCSSSDMYILQQQDGDGTTFSATGADLEFVRGTPAVCHRLTDSHTHLNGKLGELHDYDADTCQYTIHFEDETLYPITVKAENIRVVFDLPEK